MSDEGARSVRQSVLGADRALRVIDGGGASVVPPPDDEDCGPVTPLGHLDGTLYFLDVKGQKRTLTARQLGNRNDMLLLYGGSAAWLEQKYPKRVEIPQPTAGDKKAKVWITVDFHLNDTAAALQRACFRAGLFGDHIVLRKPGIWRDIEGLPAVHCGDKVLLGDTWYLAGWRTDNQIWAAAAPTQRPGLACAAAVGQELQQGLTALWNWRDAGGPTAVMGLICNGYYGAAPEWRPSAFVTGETGGGKSALLATVRAALPVHHHDNDTTKAGIEQAVDGRAMAIVIDEAADRANRGAARDLADLVLSASGGEGTRGSRGTSDGRGRRIELAGLIVMFAINPPDLEPQHLGRLTLLDLRKPERGADFRAQHKALERFARKHARDLWARALAGWDRYCAALERFREGLSAAGCAPREMDQAGALLAGWWVLTEEGVPEARGVRAGLSALHGGDLAEPGLIRGAAEIEDDSRPRRMLLHLAASMVALHRSSEREPIGKLCEIAWGVPDLFWTDDAIRRSPEDAAQLLTHSGIRIIRKCVIAAATRPIAACTCRNCADKQGRPIPRGGDGDGVWFSTQNPELRRLFAASPFEGERWRYEMQRLPSARKSQANVRIGSVPGRAIWLSRNDFLGADDHGGAVADA